MKPTTLTALIFLLGGFTAYAQADNEIQVYASPTVGRHLTIVELHSNYTAMPSKLLTYPAQAKYLNESLEITHGFTDNFELGFYVFTTLKPGGQYEYLGSHIRPRITIPENWNWKVGASLSAEFGFFRQATSQPFYWEGEIRPVIDRTAGNWYFSLNPNIEFVLNGDDRHFGIGPQFKTVYTFMQKLGLGFEYYSALGSFRRIDPWNEEEHLVGPMIDLYTNPNWEFNGGVLFGLTPQSNQRIIKILVGRRFGK